MKQQYQAVYAFITQTPGFCSANYTSRAQYNSDARPVIKDRHTALNFLAKCESEGLDITKDSGRLTIRGGLVQYVAGQYWPTEFRRAVVAHLEDVLSRAGYTEAGIKRIGKGL